MVSKPFYRLKEILGVLTAKYSSVFQTDSHILSNCLMKKLTINHNCCSFSSHAR